MKCAFRISDLPTLPGYVYAQGRTNIDYMSLLGLCSFSDHRCNKMVVKQDDLTEDFVKKFLDKMVPALAKFASEGQSGPFRGRSDQH